MSRGLCFFCQVYQNFANSITNSVLHLHKQPGRFDDCAETIAIVQTYRGVMPSRSKVARHPRDVRIRYWRSLGLRSTLLPPTGGRKMTQSALDGRVEEKSLG